MERIFRFFNREIQGLHQTAFLLASATIGAKILALLRDRLLASTFGAGKTLDIYYAAFRIPDFLYVFSLALVSTTVLIPIFLEKKERSSKEALALMNSIWTFFFLVMTISAAAVYLALPYLARFVAPGFSAADTSALINLSRILLLSPIFLGISNLFSSVVQSFRRFTVYALSGVLYNAGIIFGLALLYPIFKEKGIVLGVVFGAFLHLFVQLPVLIRLKYLPFFTVKIIWRDIKKVFLLSFPRTLGLSLNELMLTAITALASFMTAGSIAVFNFAVNLNALPLGIIALSYSVAAFPDLANKFLKNEKEKFLLMVSSTVRHMVFWLLPASAMFIVLRAQIVRVILGAGAFTWTNTRLTAASLAILSFSLFAQGLILLLVRAFYAAGKTKIPLIVNIASSIFTVSLALLLMYFSVIFPGTRVYLENFLRVGGVQGASMLVLPLAYSLGTIVNVFLLWLFFKKNFTDFDRETYRSFLEIIFVSVIIGFTSYVFLGVFDDVFDINTFIGVFMQGFLAGIFGLIAGIFGFKLLKNAEFREFVLALKNRLPRKKPIAPEIEELP